MKSVAVSKIVGKLPVVRSTLYTAPKYHIGSPIENRLGLQVLRVLSKKVSRSLRRGNVSSAVESHVRILEEDGFLVLPNFLAPEQFNSVVTEFEAASIAAPLEPYQGVANAKLFRRQVPVADAPELFPVIKSTFQMNAALDQIVSAIIRRPVTTPPDVLLDTYHCVNGSGEDNDIENILHADLHVPTIKMFFYLSRTDESNGAFVYAKSSHRLTVARLLHEYEMSVRQAKLNRGQSVEPQLLERRSKLVRNIVRPEHRRRMKIEETQLCVEANTLVIVNNMGFHRRGEFRPGQTRKALLINYRNAEPVIG